MAKKKKKKQRCEVCGRKSDDLKLVSDGTDSGESDLLCPVCRGDIYKPSDGHEIHTLESCSTAVTLKLKNGVVIQVCSNRGYVHVHFSGIGSSQVTATPCSNLGQDLKYELEVANNINLFYRDPEQR